MSHAYGVVKFSDGDVLHFEYNGTVDVCLPNLYSTQEELSKDWRNQTWKHHSPNCNLQEDALMATNYGGGLGWNIKACKFCKLITDYHSCEDHQERNYISTMPDWARKYLE